MEAKRLLELRGISRSFGGVRALEGVDFDLAEGEVHGLVGENGAGKSTLMKILAGVYAPQEGEIRLRGEPVRFASPKEARRHGIGMIHQELSCVKALTVAENLWLGDPPRNRLGMVDWRRMRRDGAEHLRELGIELDVRTPLEELPLGLQQLIEVARVTHSGADILVMDEPTSALSPPEVERLFALIRRLKEQKKSIVFISHFIDDVLAVCDRVSVLRDGRNAGTSAASSLTKHAVVHAMLGEGADALEAGYERERRLGSDPSAPVVLEVRGACKDLRLSGLDLEVRAGEILGVYGPMGSGHVLLGECLYGLQRFDRGEVRLDGAPVRPGPSHRMKRRGLAYVSSDRAESLFLESEIYKNVSAAFLREVVSFPLRRRAEENVAREMVERLRVKTPSVREILSNLSGGNQQKVALARWLVHPIRVMILNEPTRGMDVGAKEDVMRIVGQLKEKGVAILLISSEPETVIAHSDRIVAMSKGRIVREFAEGTVGKDELLRCA